MDALNTYLLQMNERFPGFVNIHLWKPNVFNGGTLLNFAKPGVSIMAADASTALLRLQELNVIEPRRFNPSHSARAFLGLQYRNVTEPCPGTAYAFDWEVVNGSIGRRWLGLNNPAATMGDMF